MAIAAFPYTSFTGTILSSQVMADFNHLRDHYNSNAVELSGNQTVAGVKTFSDIPVLSLGATITAGGLTVTAGNVALTAGNLTFGAASARIIPGATSLLFRDSANANTNVTITDAGAVTIRAGLTVTAGGLTVSAGTTAVAALTATTVVASSTATANTFAGGAASSKFLIGSTNLLFRDSTDATTLATFTSGAFALASSVGFSCGGGAGVGTITCTGASVVLGASTNGSVQISSGGTSGSVDITGTAGLINLGGTGLATNSTINMPRMATIGGTPTGVVAAGTYALDATGNKLWVSYGGGTWKSTTLA